MNAQQSQLQLPFWAAEPRTIGDPGAVALGIELQSALSADRPWLYGSLTVTLAHHLVPTDEDGVDFVSSAIDARALVAASYARYRPDLDELNASEVFHELIGKHYESVVPGGWINRTAHVLSEVFDSAYRDACHIVVYRRADQSDRIIWSASRTTPRYRTGEHSSDLDLLRHNTAAMVSETLVPPGTLDLTLLSFANFVEEVLRELGFPGESYPTRKA